MNNFANTNDEHIGSILNMADAIDSTMTHFDLLDPFRSELATKATKLGFSADIIRETFTKFRNNRPPTENEFFDKLINYALELEINNEKTVDAFSDGVRLPDDEQYYAEAPQYSLFGNETSNVATRQTSFAGNSDSDQSLQSINQSIGELSVRTSSFESNIHGDIQKATKAQLLKNLRPIIIDGDDVGTM
jgi:hypothetical protein